VSLKRELARAHRRLDSRQQELQAGLAELQNQLGKLAERVTQLEQQSSQLPALSPLRPSINLHRRSQILRLHHKGEPPEQIAATLGIPVNEVQLVIKIHELVSAS